MSLPDTIPVPLVELPPASGDVIAATQPVGAADTLAEWRFRAVAREIGVDPDDVWVGRYVDYEWAHARHVFQAYPIALAGQQVLEFGCNFGASAIVLARLGAEVTALDVNPDYLRLAQANAELHGVAHRIRFVLVEDSAALPLASGRYSLVNCNSVLEYVDPGQRQSVLGELERVLEPGGYVVVSGTSNRLALVEIHCRLWGVNYLPRALDRWVYGGRRTERGVLPWSVRQGFPSCRNVDWETRGSCYIEARERIGASAPKLAAIRALNAGCRLFGVWMGYLTPSIAVVLRKGE